MKKLLWLGIPLAALLMGADCGTDDSDTDTGGDTDDCWYDGDLLIATVDYTCSPATSALDNFDGTWTYSVETDGLAAAIDLDIFETGDPNPSAAWSESHDLSNTAYDADCGVWDQWDLSLAQQASAGSQTANVDSHWGCAWDNDTNGAGGSLAWMVTMIDDNNAATDCAIWGYESDQYWNTSMGNSCVCFDPDEFDCTD